MPRTARERSMYGYYHVILRGIDRQALFHEDMDRHRLLDKIRKYSAENNITVLAYTLMNNHIHLLLKSEDKSFWSENLSRFIKQLSSSYVRYFNDKYDRTGHLFQERFHSEPVDTGRYLLTVTRYILQNPFKAGLGAADQYPWSSYHETFLGVQGFCNADLAVKTAGSLENLRSFVLTQSDDKCLEYHRDRLITDEEAEKRICEIIGAQDARLFLSLSKEQRDDSIKKFRSFGITNAQISRLTGISRSTLTRHKE